MGSAPTELARSDIVAKLDDGVDISKEYVQRLRALVQEETAMQEQRMDHFFSKEFEQDNAGPLFPLSWTSNMEISHEGKCRPQLHPRQDFAQAHMLEDALESVVPDFDKVTEDGSRFSIYRIGSLEVRTIAEHDSEPVIGAVFSVHAATEDKQAISEQEEVVKATEYVERAGLDFQVYLVLETDQKNKL